MQETINKSDLAKRSNGHAQSAKNKGSTAKEYDAFHHFRYMVLGLLKLLFIHKQINLIEYNKAKKIEKWDHIWVYHEFVKSSISRLKKWIELLYAREYKLSKRMDELERRFILYTALEEDWYTAQEIKRQFANKVNKYKKSQIVNVTQPENIEAVREEQRLDSTIQRKKENEVGKIKAEHISAKTYNDTYMDRLTEQVLSGSFGEVQKDRSKVAKVIEHLDGVFSKLKTKVFNLKEQDKQMARWLNIKND